MAIEEHLRGVRDNVTTARGCCIVLCFCACLTQIRRTRVRGLSSLQPRAQNRRERETRLNNKDESPVQTTNTHNAMIRNGWQRAIQVRVCVCVWFTFFFLGRGGRFSVGTQKELGTSIKGVQVWVYGGRWLVLQKAQHPRPPPPPNLLPPHLPGPSHTSGTPRSRRRVCRLW